MKTKFTRMLKRKGETEYEHVHGTVELDALPNRGSTCDVTLPNGTVVRGKIVTATTPASGHGPAFGVLEIEEC
jgi:hypothetical protein